MKLLQMTRFALACAMLCELAAGAFGYGHEVKVGAALGGGLVAFALKVTHVVA